MRKLGFHRHKQIKPQMLAAVHTCQIARTVMSYPNHRSIAGKIHRYTTEKAYRHGVGCVSSRGQVCPSTLRRLGIIGAKKAILFRDLVEASRLLNSRLPGRRSASF